MANRVIAALYFVSISFLMNAQDSTFLNVLEDTVDKQWNPPTTAIFKATQIVNTPTVEAPAEGGLQFMIMHRFGRINEGSYALFGLDNATIRFALDYGLTDRLAVGIGRSSFEKVFDGSVKWKLIRQMPHKSPVAISLYALIANTTQKYSDKSYLNARYRTMYTTQLLIARKFTSNLSLQISPAWVHYNLVPTPQDKNDVLAIGLGGRMKITGRVSINAEYNLLPDNQVVSTNVDPSFSLGTDIETGGHVFQLVFTNSQGMIAPYYLGKTTGKWGKGDIYFGFNITRIFHLKGKQKRKKVP
ncbi:MAG: DUF5777 family beta-barrel protein [Chitinophagaceae bacterium]